jgi:hypothetical protein
MESTGLVWIHDYVRARTSATAQEAFQDVERGQTPRHADLQHRRCPFGPTYIANKGAPVRRHAHREKPMLGSVPAANRAAGVKVLDESPQLRCGRGFCHLVWCSGQPVLKYKRNRKGSLRMSRQPRNFVWIMVAAAVMCSWRITNAFAGANNAQNNPSPSQSTTASRGFLQ